MGPKDISQFFGAARVKARAGVKLGAKRSVEAMKGDDAKTGEENASKCVKIENQPKVSKGSGARKMPSTAAASVETKSGAGEETAAEVLARIPSADPSYLVIDPEMEGKSFFQLKAAQTATPTGHRDIPVGRPGCLTGLTIVFTGVLPSIERGECERLAQQYGAKVTKAVSGKTSCVVIGREAGPSKIKKILAAGTKAIDEDGFVQLIASMPVGGGSGEQATKARAKQEELERKALEDAQREAQAEQAAHISRNSAVDVKRTSTSLGTVTKAPVPDNTAQLWTAKYAPTDIKQICGNKGNVETLHGWLARWFDTRHDLKGAGIDSFRAVLISGPPGIGKTTAATVIAKSLGYDTIETNASDFRSKKLLNDHLKVALDNTSVAGFFDGAHTSSNSKKLCLIMDEVDGMSSGDNGGMAQIAQFCRITRTPMVLICNDKTLPKMRTLDRCTFDMVWRRPTAREMKSRLMTIAHREGLKLDPNLIDQLVAITHNDMRQIINIMATVARTQASLNFGNLTAVQDSWEKEVSLKPFEVLPRLLSSNRLSTADKMNLYFSDMDIVPLMVHENYKATRPPGGPREHLEAVATAADYISQSDIVSSMIRGSNQQWSLLPLHAVLSTVAPATAVAGQVTARINFTSFLGQNSKRMKFDRIVQNLQYHTCTRTHANNRVMREVYVPYIRDKLLDILTASGKDGIDTVLSALDAYCLTKEDFDSMLELAVSGTRKDDTRYKSVPTAVKSALTRRYNSYAHPTVIYKTGDSVSKRTKSGVLQGADFGPIDDEESETTPEQDDEDRNDISKDSLVSSRSKSSAKSTTRKVRAK